MTHQDKSAVRSLIMELLGTPDQAGALFSGVDRGDAMRLLWQAGLQDLIEAEASAVVGAGRYERGEGRVTRVRRVAPESVGHQGRDG
jgi:hypothetical protein